jgi:hypothetical protein
MSQLIIPGQNDHLIDPAYDKFLDGHPTRRELQRTFNKIGVKLTEAFEGLDTQALVGNFLCERAGVTREEITAYVQKKAAEVQAQAEEALAAATREAQNNAQSHS